jgi:hypothetical protein
MMNDKNSSIDPSELSDGHVQSIRKNDPQIAPAAADPQCPEEMRVMRQQLFDELGQQIRNLRVPILIAALFLFCTKFIPLWLFLILLFLTGEALLPYLPEPTRLRIRKHLQEFQSNHGLDPRLLKNLREGIRAMKPFLMTALFFAAAPVAVVWMTGHYVRRMFARERKESVRASGSVVLKQNVRSENDEETNFFHSRAFSVTIIAIVGLGMPVAVIMLLYSSLGIENVLNQTLERPYYNSQAAEVAPPAPIYDTGMTPIKGRRIQFWQDKRRFRFADGPIEKVKLYEPDGDKTIDLEHFAVYAYLMSLGWCLSVLFMRAWMTFPFNFGSTEYDFEVDEDGLRKHPIKGWFAELIWYCWPSFSPCFLSWKDVKQVSYTEGGFGRLSPLPASLFTKESLVYKCLNRIAMATDACVDRIGRSEYISFDCAASQNGYSILPLNINLWELSSDDKARLFYAIRTYAPDLHIGETVQEKLIGSKILNEARYTQLWFDMLTSEQERKRHSSLNPNDTLCGGKYTVVQKIGSGGQAAVFLVRNQCGEELALKEFILTSADTFGALLESATDFENESSILSRLNHPSVVKFVDIFAEDKRAYIVLEHVKGTTLRRQVVDEGPMSEKDAVDCALKMCDVLGYLHSQSPPVVHRDFTPENLILQNDGTLKVVDFSVASRTGPHKSGDCVGKHSYTPPEQFRSQASPQSDIYALGATLYFLVTGSDPKPITMSDPRCQNKNVSNKLAHIVMKATALDLNERYESISWLRLELEEMHNSFGTRDFHPGLAEVGEGHVESPINCDHSESKGLVLKFPKRKAKSLAVSKSKARLKHRR